MSTKYYSISNTPSDIANALSDKGLITQNYYQSVDGTGSAGYLIFSSPLTSKILKIKREYAAGPLIYHTLYYGDSVTETSYTDETHTFSGGVFTLTHEPLKNNSSEFYSGAGKTGTHWIKNTNYTINNSTGVVTNINCTGTVYCNYKVVATALVSEAALMVWGTSSQPTISSRHMVCDTNFFMMYELSTVNTKDGCMYCGALDSGDVLAFMMGTGSGNPPLCKNLTSGVTMYPLGIGTPVSTNDGGYLVAQNLLWQDTAGNILKNGDNPATTVGVLNTSWIGNNLKTAQAVITAGQLYCGVSSSYVMNSALLIPYSE